MKRELAPPFDRARAVAGEVSRASDLVAKLRLLLQLMPLAGERSGEAGTLLQEILNSLSMAFLALDQLETTSPAALPDAPVTLESSACWEGGGSVESGKRNREGNLQSRKPLESWTIVTSIPYHDGHEWRKYGQKKIHRAKFPRCYYRCTHHDKGCPATKQVQQQDSCDDPPMFNVTYNKQHTCNNGSISTKALVRDSAPIKPGLSGYESDYNGIIKQEGILLSTSPSGNRDFAGELKTSSTPSDDSTSSDLTTIESRAMAGDMSFDYDMLMDSLGHGSDFWLDDLEYYL